MIFLFQLNKTFKLDENSEKVERKKKKKRTQDLTSDVGISSENSKNELFYSSLNFLNEGHIIY